MTRFCDPLTGLPNSRALEEALKQRLKLQVPTALALVDLDGLIQVNSDFGDDVGDALIQKLAEVLRCSAPDGLYRISGDEFAFLLDNTSLEQAFLLMERVRAKIADTDHFHLPDGRHMTVSIGVAQAPRDGSDPHALLHVAQAALQGAKESGRNRVGLPPNEEMIMKTCYYPASSVRRLQTLAKRLNCKESPLLREALDDLIRKYDVP